MAGLLDFLTGGSIWWADATAAATATALFPQQSGDLGAAFQNFAGGGNLGRSYRCTPVRARRQVSALIRSACTSRWPA